MCKAVIVAVLACLGAGVDSHAADLASAGTLTARVLDLRGAALPGATLVLERTQGGGAMSSTADDEGACRVTAAPGRYRVTVTAAGRCAWRQPDLVLSAGSQRALTIALQPCAEVGGVVRDGAGQPVVGARVRIDFARQRPPGLRPGSESEGDLAGGKLEAVTAADGRFRLGSVPRVSGYLIDVRHSDYAPLLKPLDLDRAGAGDLALMLKRGAVIRGLARGLDDKPVAGVEIVAIDLSRAGEDRSSAPHVTSGPDGTFAINALAAGRWRVEVRPPSGIEQRLGPYELTDGEPRDLGVVRVRPGVAVSGRVVDALGGPVADARVLAFTRGNGARVIVRRAKSGKDGAFTLAGLAEAHYDLRVEPGAPWLSRDEGDVAAPRRGLELRVPRAGWIEGRVVAAEPVESLRVSALVPGRGARGWYAGEIIDAERGTFRIASLPQGTYVVEAIAAGQGRARSAPIEVAEGGAAGPLELTLERGFVLDGVVIEKSGSGIAGARVLLADDAQGVVTTGLDGRFRLTNARSGQNTLVATHPDFAPSSLAVALDPEKPAPVTLALGAGGRMEGRVLRASGAPVSGVRVEAKPEVAMIGPRATWTDAAGAFRFEHLPAGPVAVARIGGGSPFEERDEKHVVLEDGATATVDFVVGGRVLGRVTRGGLPLADVRVSLAWAPNSFTDPDEIGKTLSVRSAWTDPDGNYQLDGVHPGTSMLTIAAGEQFSERHVDVADAPEVRLDVAMPDRALQGVVVERGGAPVADVTIDAWANRGSGGSWASYRMETGPDGERYQLAMGDGAERESLVAATDGTFTLWTDPAAEYRVQAEGWSRGSAAATVPAGPDVKPLRLVLARKATLHLNVRGPAGEALDDVYACALRTDADGFFSSSCSGGVHGSQDFDLQVGEAAEVVAAAPGFAARSVKVGPLRADGDGAPNEVTLTLPRAGAVIVHLAPGAATDVTSVRDTGGTEWGPVLGPVQQVKRGTENGAPFVKIDGLAPGVYTVTLGVPDKPVTARAEVRAGEIVDIYAM